MQSDVNMEEYLREKKSGKRDLPKQPYILALRDGGHITRCFIVIEYQALAVHSVKKAFDLLHKSFYVFDLQYPQPLEALYGFVDLLHDSSACVANSVREKFNLLFQ